MRLIPIVGFNNILKALDTNGNCADLHIKALKHPDGQITLTSAWLPTPGEYFKLQQGSPILLHIYGTQHPPVAISVGLQDDVPKELRFIDLRKKITDIDLKN